MILHLYNLHASHQLFVYLSVDDYLGFWFATDWKGSTSMHFCFRIAEGKIGMKPIHLINKRIDFQYKVIDNKLQQTKGLSGSRRRIGEYDMDAKIISWSTTEGVASIWIRPGN